MYNTKKNNKKKKQKNIMLTMMTTMFKFLLGDGGYVQIVLTMSNFHLSWKMYTENIQVTIYI